MGFGVSAKEQLSHYTGTQTFGEVDGEPLGGNSGYKIQCGWSR